MWAREQEPACPLSLPPPHLSKMSAGWGRGWRGGNLGTRKMLGCGRVAGQPCTAISKSADGAQPRPREAPFRTPPAYTCFVPPPQQCFPRSSLTPQRCKWHLLSMFVHKPFMPCGGVSSNKTQGNWKHRQFNAKTPGCGWCRP